MPQPVDEHTVEAFALPLVSQAIQPYILVRTGRRIIGKGKVDRRGNGHVSPGCFLYLITETPILWHTVLIKGCPVFHDVLGNATQVQVQVSAIGIVTVLKGIHHPEFHILDVVLLEIRLIHGPHDATPLILRVFQFAIFLNSLRIVVIRSAPLREKGNVKRVEVSRDPCRILPVTEHLCYVYPAHVVVRLHLPVTGDVVRGEAVIAVE